MDGKMVDLSVECLVVKKVERWAEMKVDLLAVLKAEYWVD